MKIGFDIRSFVKKKKTGVGYYTDNLLNALLNIDKKDIFIYMQKKVFFLSKKKIPKFKHANVKYSIDRFNFMKANGLRNCDVILTSSFDLPKKSDQKMVIVVHDVIHRTFPGWPFPRDY